VDLEIDADDGDCKSLLFGVVTRQNGITRFSEMRVIKKRPRDLCCGYCCISAQSGVTALRAIERQSCVKRLHNSRGVGRARRATYKVVLSESCDKTMLNPSTSMSSSCTHSTLRILLTVPPLSPVSSVTSWDQ